MADDLRRVHCSYHKCLTVYFGIVMSQLCNDWFPRRGGYRHYNSLLDEFYAGVGRSRVASVNNHALDLDRLGRFRITRFVRDPRDLVVSGYHYHRRGAEAWCRVVGPGPDDWKIVNGRIPDGMPAHHSYATWLQSLPEEDGIIAEIQFREHHFASMAAWPERHPDILTLRYEDILGHEVGAFVRMLRFLELSMDERLLGRVLAWRYAAGQQKGATHIRNPEPAQWKKRFTPRVSAYFAERHGDLIQRLGYLP